MTKITLTDLVNLQNETTAVNAINGNNATVKTALDNTLSRDGTQPNQMTSSLDMNSNQIINLPVPATGNSPLRLQDLTSFVGGGIVTNIPPGGTTGQMLAKTSNADYAVAWTPESSEISAGSNIVLTGTTPTLISTSSTPTFTTVTTPTLTNTGVLTLPTSADTLVGRATTDTLTNKTYDTAGTGNVFRINGTTITTNTGTGSNVLATSPTIVTPVISSIVNTGTLTLPTSTDTLMGKATTDIFTNKTFDTAGTGNVFKINGTQITANTGTGSNVLATSPTLVTPVLGAATATSLTFSPTTGGVVGTTTNNNTTAGNVGELIEGTLSSGSPVSLTTNTPANIISISLTAGDWDVGGNAYFTTAATTNVNYLYASSSVTSATLSSVPGQYNQSLLGYAPTAGVLTINCTPYRISLASTTTVFLVVQSAFTVSTLTCFGYIRARRVR